MSRTILLPFLILIACTQKYGYQVPTDDTGEEKETDTDVDADSDSDTDDGFDADGDGYSVEQGDCDDSDIYVSPARDEDPADGKDNDCDGRTDEEWSGVSVSWYEASAIGSSIVTLDTLGRKIGETTLSGEAIPLWLDHAVGDGWVVNNGCVYLAQVDTAGNLTTIADFSQDDWGIYGVATHPDGYYLTTSVDDLWRIDPDGTTTLLASWSADTSDPTSFDMIVYTVAVDPLSGDVGLFCYYGGFAVYSEAEGLTIYRRADVEAWDGLITYSGAHRDGGGWYSLTYDSNTGVIGVSRFNLTDNTWVLKAEWSASQWLPNVLSIDGDSGDYYVTANGGWHYTVWRMLADGSFLSDFYDTYEENPDAQDRGFWGIVTNY